MTSALAKEQKVVAQCRRNEALLDRLFASAHDPALDAVLRAARHASGPFRRRGRLRIQTKPSRATAQAWAIGQRVAALRNARGWTQQVLADRSGIAQANIARVETGRHPPQLKTVNRIAGALGVAVTELLREPAFMEAQEDRQWAEAAAREWPES